METLEVLLLKLGFTDITADEISIPGSMRLEFQERCIELYEPGIFSDPELNLPGTTQLSRLCQIYSDLGISFTPDIILGNCTQSSSVTLLIALLTLLLPNSLQPSTIEPSISFLASNPLVFDPTLKLFPPTFPPKYPKSKSFIEELEATLEHWQQEYKRLATFHPEATVWETPTQDAVHRLRNNIIDFCDAIQKFRICYETEIQRYMGEGASKTDFSIGKWSKACVGSYEKLFELFMSIEHIWSSINILINS
jgi:hypothetical protein